MKCGNEEPQCTNRKVYDKECSYIDLPKKSRWARRLGTNVSSSIPTFCCSPNFLLLVIFTYVEGSVSRILKTRNGVSGITSAVFRRLMLLQCGTWSGPKAIGLNYENPGIMPLLIDKLSNYSTPKHWSCSRLPNALDLFTSHRSHSSTSRSRSRWITFWSPLRALCWTWLIQRSGRHRRVFE
jgi:hypothetical protein